MAKTLTTVNTFKLELKDFEISVRSNRILKKLGIKTIGQLANYDKETLLEHKNFGVKSIMELDRILRPYGLSLN